MLPKDANECYHSTIQDCLAGDYLSADKDTSYEQLYYQTGMLNPRARIVTNPHRPLNIVTALARFTWMMAGNNRLEDIAFYEPKVRGYTDNQLTVPGSSYGARLFEPAPGLNQIEGVITRLREVPQTRQAAAVVWLPQDAVRHSNDIPCTFGLFFHIREEQLNMCLSMRSNNAYRLLQFNLFEFSMLQEVVAATLGVDLGVYTHWAASMHVYDNDFEMPQTTAIAKDGPGTSTTMPAMPKHDALEQAVLMAQLEGQMRHVYNDKGFAQVMQRAATHLNTYWLDLFSILACYNALKRGYRVSFAMPQYLLPQLKPVLESAGPKEWTSAK